MIDTFLGFLLTIISLSIGFYLGRNNFSNAKETLVRTRQVVEDVIHGKSDVGVVERPDPHDLRRMSDPKFAAEEDEMVRQLDELQKRKVD
jgi:hypothetical protein